MLKNRRLLVINKGKEVFIMDEQIKLDQYMLCLDVDSSYPDVDIVFWLDYLEKNVKGKIHIISYRTINSKIQEKYSKEKFRWIFGLAKSYEMIGKYIEEQLKEDAIVVVGGERLAFGYIEKNISSMQLGKIHSNLYLQEGEDWTRFSKFVDQLYEKYQSSISALVFICNVNQAVSDRIINKELKDSVNMSVSVMENTKCCREKANNVVRVLHEIEKKPLEEALKIIEENEFETCYFL